MPRFLPTLIGAVVSLSCLGVSMVMPLFLRAEDLQAIQQRGHLIVGIKDNARPLGFRSADGQLQGFEIEIAKRLAKDLLGKEDAVILKPVLNKDRISVILDGQVDITIARVTATILRSRLVVFSLPYYLDRTVLVTKDKSLQRMEDIGTQKVAVLNNSSTVATLRYRLPNATLVGVDSYDTARDLLEQGGAIAFAADATVLSGWVQEFPAYHLLSSSLSVEPLCIVMPKGLQYNELRQRINEILARWIEEGWLQDRAAYWGLP